MNNLINLGAINIKTKEYESPIFASKSNEYKCPDCDKKVMLKKGKIKRPHFAHFKSQNTCNYYNHPGESQIHFYAKELLKYVLQNKKCMICRKCDLCRGNIEQSIVVNATNIVKKEYIFEYNGKKIADVAVIDNNNIKYIFEIYHKHATLEVNRPEPWFEIEATNLIQNIENNTNESILIDCIRSQKCDVCSTAITNLLKLSYIKEYETAKREWYKIGKECLSNFNNLCVCQRKCKNIVYLYNHITKKIFVICSICHKSLKISKNNEMNEMLKNSLQKLLLEKKYKTIGCVIEPEYDIDKLIETYACDKYKKCMDNKESIQKISDDINELMNDYYFECLQNLHEIIDKQIKHLEIEELDKQKKRLEKLAQEEKEYIRKQNELIEKEKQEEDVRIQEQKILEEEYMKKCKKCIECSKIIEYGERVVIDKKSQCYHVACSIKVCSKCKQLLDPMSDNKECVTERKKEYICAKCLEKKNNSSAYIKCDCTKCRTIFFAHPFNENTKRCKKCCKNVWYTQEKIKSK